MVLVRAQISTFLRRSKFAIIILSCQAQKHPLTISRTRLITLLIIQLTAGGCRKMQRVASEGRRALPALPGLFALERGARASSHLAPTDQEAGKAAGEEEQVLHTLQAHCCLCSSADVVQFAARHGSMCCATPGPRSSSSSLPWCLGCFCSLVSCWNGLQDWLSVLASQPLQPAFSEK